MMKRLHLIILLLVAYIVNCHAVLKEKDLDNTLSILRSELTEHRAELEKQTRFMQERQQMIRTHLVTIMAHSAQNSLMLYSQKPDYIFDLTYACHEATEMYSQFQKQTLPFRTYITKNEGEIARYDSLIINLNQMQMAMMSDRAKIDRNVCLTLAINIRRTLQANNDQMADYITYYKMTEQRLKSLNDYANVRYAEIQSNIFRNGSDSYLKILSDFGSHLKSMTTAVNDKYKTHQQRRIRSQWDVKIIMMLFAIILIYGFVAFLLNLLCIRFIMPKRLKTPEFRSKQNNIIMATSMVTLAIILGIIKLVVSEQNFLVMASGLLIEYAWLLSVILISLILRLEGSQIKSAIRIYAPLIIMGFLVISFRIVLIPNDIVNLIFPPILLICTIWQWIVIRKHNDNIPKSDVTYTYISLLVFISSVICSWIGYTLLSVQMLIWWVMQLTCILTITCLSGWMRGYASKKGYADKPITQRWGYDMMYQVARPILGIASLIIALYWAADVFNMGDTTWKMFSTEFIKSQQFSASIESLCVIAILYFVFAYINRSVKELLAIHFEKSDHSTAASKNMLARNIVQIVVWGLWTLIALALLQVSTTWLAVITAGLSTGIGFASKDILENIYYGISLMTGRIKIGDLIECDGTRGTVTSISYTSTLLSIADGSVIAFQNSQLFTKNYKNLTKNHGYELDKIDVGVAYGTDIRKVKALLIENVSKLPFLEEGKPVNVIVDSLADSCVALKVLVWVPVLTHYVNDGEILECIYNTLNDNNIEIPFPQIDVHSK